MSAERAQARRVLLDVLQAHDAAGRAIPCQLDPDPAWTSDDAEEQALAARLCVRCPGIDACRTYGTTYPREAGVYGGLTEHDRRRAIAA